VLAPFLLACLFTIPKKQLPMGIAKVGLAGIVGVALVEGEIWNKFLLRLYLAQKYNQK
jgi:hypothetical protein